MRSFHEVMASLDLRALGLRRALDSAVGGKSCAEPFVTGGQGSSLSTLQGSEWQSKKIEFILASSSGKTGVLQH